MKVLLNAVLLAATAVFMEFVAWFTHKYVMHGFLWVLHEDHHRPRHRGLQKNDLFALFFSLVSFSLIYSGWRLGRMPMASAGLGVALYGVGYVLFHDVMFHRRIPGIRIRARGRYLRRIVRAHAVHHQKSGQKKGGVSFSFLYASKRYSE
jgi:beta-carotene 3-hydroxylase